MWSIGDVKFESKVILAPMAGITFLSYRNFMKPFGVAYSVTEMISDAGISYRNKKTIEYLKTSKIDRPIAIQLFGNNIEHALNAIDFINNELKLDYDFLDLNLACPVNKIYNNKSGSYWLNDLDSLFVYVNEIVKHSIKPVTAKIRIGIDDDHINAFETVKVLQKAGVKAIAIHARSKKQLYYGVAQYEKIKDIGKTVDIPIIISGDIFTLKNALDAINITAATAVMVARGGVGNPNLIRQIDHYFRNNEIIPDCDFLTQIQYCKKLAKMVVEEKGEKSGLAVLRGIAPKFFTKFSNTKNIRIKIACEIKSIKELFDYLDLLEKQFKK